MSPQIHVLLGPHAATNAQRKRLAVTAAHPLVPVFGPHGAGAAAARPSGALSPSTSALPPNVHMQALRAYEAAAGSQINSTTLVRLQHLYAAGEDPVLSKPVSVDLQQLLRVPPSSCRETSLTGIYDVGVCPDGPVTLEAMDIRTFAVQLGA